MIWTIVIISLGLASARKKVEPDYLDSLRNSGNDEEFAKLLGINVNLVRPDQEGRSEGTKLNHVSHLGDILLTEEQERQGLNMKTYANYKWPNGVVPIDISNEYNEDERNRIINAYGAWNGIVKNVKIVYYNKYLHNDYVYIFSGKGCYSYMGKRGGQQALSLQRDGCLTSGTIQHEMMHAVGFAHEHNRSDRDKYVEVLWKNIPENWWSQYDKVKESDFPCIEEYDYGSIMHYPMWAPDNYKEDAFKILKPGVDRNLLGQDNGLSKMDVYKIDALYAK